MLILVLVSILFVVVLVLILVLVSILFVVVLVLILVLVSILFVVVVVFLVVVGLGRGGCRGGGCGLGHYGRGHRGVAGFISAAGRCHQEQREYRGGGPGYPSGSGLGYLDTRHSYSPSTGFLPSSL